MSDGAFEINVITEEFDCVENIFAIRNELCGFADATIRILVFAEHTGSEWFNVSDDDNIFAIYKYDDGFFRTHGGKDGDSELVLQALKLKEKQIVSFMRDGDINIIIGRFFSTHDQTPYLAWLAYENNCPCVVLATMPFAFEGKSAVLNAFNKMEQTRKYTDSVIPIDLQLYRDEPTIVTALMIAES